MKIIRIGRKAKAIKNREKGEKDTGRMLTLL
jgi:hypothetical protein